MASGRLGAIDLGAGLLSSLYVVPASTQSVININICNRGNVGVKIRLAVIDGPIGSAVNADYIEYDLVLSPNGVVERTGIVLNAGGTIAVQSDIASVSAVCWGFEDSTI